MIIIGIDPGLSGALCFLNSGESICAIYDMPTLSLSRSGKNRREIDAYALANQLSPNGLVGHAFVEQSWPRPDDGAMAGFAFGKSYGIVIGVLAARGVPVTFVSPQAWKRALGLPKGKDAARARASELMPSGSRLWPLKKHDGRAEAALIALWGIRAFNAIANGEAA